MCDTVTSLSIVKITQLLRTKNVNNDTDYFAKIISHNHSVAERKNPCILLKYLQIKG